jgi:hypothetical protein
MELKAFLYSWLESYFLAERCIGRQNPIPASEMIFGRRYQGHEFFNKLRWRQEQMRRAIGPFCFEPQFDFAVGGEFKTFVSSP